MKELEPTVALVFSPERWVEHLHRHLSHHGGARVRQVVVEPTVALDEDYDILVVSDRWPSLTRGLVVALHERARNVLGVFDPDEPVGKDHLVALGVDATLPADTPMPEFVDALRALHTRVGNTGGASEPASRALPADGQAGLLVAVDGVRGSGVTELALGLSVALAERREVVLLDAHESAPALAGRLGLGVEPNLATAVDACSHGIGRLQDCFVAVTHGGRGSVVVLPGHPSPVAAAQVSTQEFLDVVSAARRARPLVVVDAEERTVTGRAVLELADVVVGVVAAGPVGVVRGIEWLADDVGRARSAPVHLVVNRAPASRFLHDEMRAEIARTCAPESVSFCPVDLAVTNAAWNGAPVTRGRFPAACARVAARVDPVGPTRRRRWAR